MDIPLTGSIFDAVEERITASSPDQSTLELWTEIRANFEVDGPGGVKDEIDARVRKLRSAAKADLKTTRSVATVTSPKKKAVARRSVPAKPRTTK